MVVPSLIVLTLLGVAGAGAGYLALQSPPAALGALGVAVLAALLTLYAAGVVYKKERYEILPTRLVAHRGTIFSDQTTELEVKNITHVKRRLPWIRYKLFGTGDVMIESAGSSSSEVVLRSVQRPREVYAQIQALMRQNGFQLAQQHLLHEERPDLLGVVLEVLGFAASAFFAIAYVGLGMVMASPVLGGIAASAVVCVFSAGLLIYFLDMRRRTYRVYDDVLVYEEGFLTRDDAFIPSENLADSNTHRTLVDRILGLFDVRVSCQGAGQEIAFRRLRHGVALDAAIGRVIAASKDRPRPGTKPEPEGADAEGAEGEDGRRRRSKRAPVPLPTPSGAAWTGQLNPALGRTIAPFVIGMGVILTLALISVPLVLALGNPMALGMFAGPPLAFICMGAGSRLLQAACTRFEVREGSVKSRFSFLSVQEREFTYDKITGVQIREWPFDRWLGTLTIRLWSIGADQPLDLFNVRHEDVDLTAFLIQTGVTSQDDLLTIPARFNLRRYLRANFAAALLAGVVVVGLVAAALVVDLRLLGLLALPGLIAVGAYAYGRAYYPRMQLRCKDRHLEAYEGLILRVVTRVRYQWVKKVQLTRYPFGDEGDLQVFVAGEQRLLPNQQKGGGLAAAAAAQQQGATVPYGFRVRYVEDLPVFEALLDELIEDGPHPEEVEAIRERRLPGPAEVAAGTLHESAPALGNRLFLLIAISVLSVGPIVLLPLTIPYTVIEVRRRRFRLERDRVVRQWGILYRSQATILYSRFDSIQRKQGFVNKMFGNATLTVFTAGSSNPDLVLEDMPDADAVYEVLKKQYR
ncbi:MAG TPA: hypothetical protein DEA08_09740 [Planctomycetes bacterium]|nr:hypothetical protein [Planctomycetota bacterium]